MKSRHADLNIGHVVGILSAELTDNLQLGIVVFFIVWTAADRLLQELIFIGSLHDVS